MVAEPETRSRRSGDHPDDQAAIPRFSLRKLSLSGFVPILILALMVLLALFLRSYFAYDLSANNDWLMSGGSDAYYYKRLMEHAVDHGAHLHWDPMLNFPDGARNPRPPLYTFAVAVPAVFMQGLFSNIYDSLGFNLIFSTALWGALTVIPTYLIAREMFGRKTGYIAALFIAIIPAHVERSVATNADHDAFALFFIVLTIYFFMKSLKVANQSRWVEDWKSLKGILSGLRNFASANEKAIVYAMLAGLSFAAIMFAWVGFAYVEVILLSFIIIQILINKFKRVDSTTITLLFAIMFGLAFLLAFPVYYQMLIMSVRFDIPVYLFLAAVVFGLLFAVTRDLPWILVFPVLGVLLAIAVVLITVINPALGEAILTGQGYFVKSKLYDTIAEARAPIFSQLSSAFGIVTFYLSFIGLFLMLYRMPKRLSGDYVLISVWLAIALFMAASAARFMFNAAPAFAISSAWITFLIIRKLDFVRVRKIFAGSSGSFFQAVRKSVKVRHVVGVLFLVFMLIVPNVWYGLDAGIPQEKKRTIDVQIYSSLPSVLRPTDYAELGGLWYLGSFGYSLPLPSYYFPALWDWFSQQNPDIMPEWKRPAYVSWWDYGFEAIQEGKHPAVADNFQQGYQVAGNILLSQSEEEAIGLMIARLLVDAVNKNGGVMPPELSDSLVRHGASPVHVMDVIQNTTKYGNIILESPERFGKATSDISGQNILWRYLGIYFADLGIEAEVDLYREVREHTGNSIEYIGVDSRLIPKSARETGVFYAPVKLTDRRIDVIGNPMDFYTIKAVDVFGMEYALTDRIPFDTEIVDYKIVYTEEFYRTMVYRAMGGFAPSDIGKSNDGLPGLSGSVQLDAPLPGWNLAHFMMVYRTAYFNPSSDGTARWQAVSLDEALELRDRIEAGEMEGLVDLSPGNVYQAGAVMLRYYDGAVLSGRVLDTSGESVVSARITVIDRYGIPHQTVLSDLNGSYSVILPPGEVTVAVTWGELDMHTLRGRQRITEIQLEVSEAAAQRRPVDTDGDGRPDWQIERDITIPAATLNGYVFWDFDDSGDFTEGVDSLIRDGTVVARNIHTQKIYTIDAGNGYFEQLVSPGMYEIDTHVNGITTKAEFQADISPGGLSTRDIPRRPTSIYGTVLRGDGLPAEGATVTVTRTDKTLPPLTVEATTDSAGDYTVRNLPVGSYLVSAHQDYLTAFDQPVRTLAIEPEQRVDFTLRFSSVLDIIVEDYLGSPVRNATVRLVNSFNPSEAQLLRADDQGKLRLSVPEGEYSLTVRVFDGTRYLVGGTSVLVPRLGDASARITIGEAVAVKGGISEQIDPSGPPEGVDGATALFYRGHVLYQTTSDRDGDFEIYLPPGEYEAVFSSFNMLATMTVIVPIREPLEILLSPSSKLSGTVWHDADRDGEFDIQSEMVAFAQVRVMLSDGVTLRTSTDLIGQFQLAVPKQEEVTLLADAIGYRISVPQTFTTTAANLTRKVQLDIDALSVSGKVVLDGRPLRGVTVDFVNPINSYSFTTGRYGEFAGQVMPSYYNITVTEQVHPDTNIYYYSSNFAVLYIGMNYHNLTIEADRRLKIQGTVSDVPPSSTVNLRIEGPRVLDLEVTDGSFEIYLPEGEYLFYAMSPDIDDQAALLKVEVTHETDQLDIELVAAHPLEGVVQFGRIRADWVLLNITQLETGMTFSGEIPPNGEFTVLLPEGEYELLFQMLAVETVGPRTRHYLLSNQSVVSMQAAVELDPILIARYYNSSLHMRIEDASGRPVAAQVQFETMDGTAISKQIASDSSGMISSSIHPGIYAVRVLDERSNQAYFGAIYVRPGVPVYLNVTLSQARNLMIVPSFANVSHMTDFSISLISIESGGRVRVTDEHNRSASFMVPEGPYYIEVDARASEKDRFATYDGEMQFNLTSDLALNVPLKRNSIYSFDAVWPEGERRAIYPGESVTYTITITNTGNTLDRYNLSGTAVNFEFSFVHTQVTADFGSGENTVTASVTITAKPTAQVEHEDVYIDVRSVGSPTVRKSVEVEIDILPVHSFNASQGKAGKVSGQEYFRLIDIENSGNVDDDYTFTVMNEHELFINGWNVTASGPEGEDAHFAVPSGAKASLNVTFAANRKVPNTNLSVVVMIVSNSTNQAMLAEATPLLPDLSFLAGPIHVIGDNMYDYDIYAERTSDNLLLLLAFVAIVASIFIVRRIRFGRFLR